MFYAIILMGGLGLVIGGVLAFASKIFYVYVDPRVTAIEEVLPGANCGGCGYPGCSANAAAIVAGKSSPDSCVASSADVAVTIAGLMGVTIGEKEPEFSQPGCHYGVDDADIKYDYEGIKDCRAAAMLAGGMKICNIGCLGFGTCVTACKFGALSMGDDGLPKVDQEKCTGCGACERICPKNIIRLTSVTRRIMREYTEDECITPCQRACPAGIDIREYIRLIRVGDNEGAVQKIKERNPFPTVIGRICPAFCEEECRRQLVDEAVAINPLKRYVCDIEMNTGKRYLPYKAPATGKKIAVIGGGVEGLSAAFFAARLGHSPSIFEATPILGGLLRVAIPEKRLPQHVLDWDIDGILEMGVKAKTGAKAGRDFTISGLLKSGFEAVFTSTGGWDSRVARGDLKKVETVFPGGYLLIDLLRLNVKKGERISCGKNVVLAGGGPMVPEAVRICRELGADKITVISRKLPENSSFDKETIDKIEYNKASIKYNTGITKIYGEDDRLTQVEYTDLDSGIKHLVDADSLIMASGRFPEFVFIKTEKLDSEVKKVVDTDLPEQDEVDLLNKYSSEPVQWEGIEIYKKPVNSREQGLLSRDDVLSGYSATILAINGGRRAAASIHRLMYGIPLENPSHLITGHSVIQGIEHVEDVEISSRNLMPIAPEGKDQEEFLPFTDEQAVNEAERCLRCGLICYKRSSDNEEENKDIIAA